jgi:hypothetical protein
VITFSSFGARTGDQPDDDAEADEHQQYNTLPRFVHVCSSFRWAMRAVWIKSLPVLS